jgi:hypothetical protein
MKLRKTRGEIGSKNYLNREPAMGSMVEPKGGDFMRIVRFLALMAMAACVLSCVWSLRPLFEESDLVFEPGLVGTWKTTDNEDTWAFERTKNSNEYVLVYHQTEFKPEGPFLGNKLVPGDTGTFPGQAWPLGRLSFSRPYPGGDR